MVLQILIKFKNSKGVGEMALLNEVHVKWMDLIQKENIIAKELLVHVSANTLTPEEAIGKPERNDYPLFLGKEVKKTYVPAFALFAYLILVAVHSIQLANLTEDLYEIYYHIPFLYFPDKNRFLYFYLLFLWQIQQYDLNCFLHHQQHRLFRKDGLDLQDNA